MIHLPLTKSKTQINQTQTINSNELPFPSALALSLVAADDNVYWNDDCQASSSQSCAAQLSNKVGGNGQFYSCKLPAVTTGFCGSQKDKACHGGKTYTDMYCDTNQQLQDLNVTVVPYKPPQGAIPVNAELGPGGWICASAGTMLSCPSPSIMIGTYGVRNDPNCKAQCPNGHFAQAAILCGIPQNDDGKNVAVVGSGTWQDRTSNGNYRQCPADQVAFGFCGSGKSASCQGRTTRLKCCDVAKPQNYGGWVAIVRSLPIVQ